MASQRCLRGGRQMLQVSTETKILLRPRRMRRTSAVRALVRETRLDPSRFIYPLFVREGRGIHEPLPAMPGQWRVSPDRLAREVDDARALGIEAILLFGLPDHKD